MRNPGKIIGYGLLLIPIWFVTLFILSMIFKSEQPIDFVGANVIVAVVMIIVTWLSARNIRVQTMKEATSVGAFWVAIVLVVLFIVGLGNKTLSIIFGHWPVYLTYVGIIAGIFLARARTPTAVPSNTP